MGDLLERIVAVASMVWNVLLPPYQDILEKNETFCLRMIERQWCAHILREHVANVYKEQGRYAEAKLQLEALFASGYRSKRGWYDYVEVLVGLGLYREAAEAGKRTLKLLGESAKLLYWTGVGELKSGEHVLAQEHLERCVALDKTNAWAHLQLGSCASKRGDYEAALKSFTTAQLLNAKVAGVQRAIALTHSNMGSQYVRERQYAHGIEAYKRSLQVTPNDAVTLYNLGLTYLKMGQRDEGIMCLKQAKRSGLDGQRESNVKSLIRDLDEIEFQKLAESLNPELGRE